MRTRLAIVIVSHNARADLEGTLASLATAPPSTRHSIVVVDNDSTDGAPAMVRARFPRVLLFEAASNLGFAQATNLGIRATSGELVLLLNPDTVVPPGAIDRLVARLDATGADAAGPRLVDADGRPELSFGRAPGPLREASRKLLLRLDGRGLGPARRLVASATSVEREVDWITGACLLVRRRAAEAVGLLDERYFLYMEDVDFCAAIRARGGRVLFTPDAEVVHLRGRSGVASGGAADRAWHASHLAYYRKHRPAWAPWLARYQRWRGIVVI
jgi:N-acetylglucosaminyl-diphospho-decaprenol L-rhamnosyltransferase